MFGMKKHSSGPINTLIGEGTRIKGDVRFSGGCHIDGVVNGSVIAERDDDAFLSLSEQGLVDGNVRVPRVSLNGKVQGHVYASEILQLGAAAKINGNLHYELLEMTAGAEINGKLIHDSAQSPGPDVPRPSAAKALKAEAEPAK
ncbi:MAG: polymer-forming cytoskeletal protein [Gammaproteobacteria bacterium]|jgi:cytoskeletal protein CcmA (bactofilin family)|nr:polymer-forming cytoskeletal protein [Gammaproteobacteria bacterium]